jgi:hypothetical protein
MTDARTRFHNAKAVREWLRERLNQFKAPPGVSGVAFFEALLIVCIRAIARDGGRERAHAVLDLAEWEIVGGAKADPQPTKIPETAG